MEWYYMQDDRQMGPHDGPSMDLLIQTGKVTSTTPVWCEGMADWLPLHETELGEDVSGEADSPGVPPAPSHAPAMERRSGYVYPTVPPRSPHLCWLNLLWPGIAQMVHEQTAKGVTLLLVTLVAFMLPPLMLPIFIVSIVDAYKVGKVLKTGRPVPKWQFFPSTT